MAYTSFTGIASALASVSGAVTCGNTGTETQLVGATIPTTFLVAGTTFMIIADGTISTKSSSVGTATFNVRIGTTTLTGNIATTVAPTLTTSLSATPWHAEFLITVVTGGSSGTIRGNGFVMGLLGASSAFVFKGTGTTGTVAIDCTASNLIELNFIWGTSNSSNTMTCYNAVIDNTKL